MIRQDSAGQCLREVQHAATRTGSQADYSIPVAGAQTGFGLFLLGMVACGSAASQQAPDAASAERQAVAELDVATDLFVNRHEPRAALKHALRAVELDEDNSEAAHLVSLIHLGFCASSQLECRLDQAEAYARKAIELRADYREARNTLGVVLVHRKRYAEAVQVLEPLTKDMLYATPETAWGNLGWAYLESGDADKAIDALQHAIGLQPEFCVGSYRLGLAYEAKGDMKAAQEALTRAVDTDRPECKALQHAFQARARVAARLGDPNAARGDYTHCQKLDPQSSVGRACATALAHLQ